MTERRNLLMDQSVEAMIERGGSGLSKEMVLEFNRALNQMPIITE